MAANLGARLRDAQEALASWYDQLNGIWKSAENELRAIHLSQPAWVCFRAETWESPDGNPAFDREIEHCLAYVKVDGDWRLCYSLAESGDPESHSPKPVLDCSLKQRKIALQGLSFLLERIVEQTEAEAAEIEIALGASAEALSHFRNHRGTRAIPLVDSDGMKVRDVLRMLQDDGWRLVVTRGSHRQLKHPVKSGRVTVAGKAGDDIPQGTLNSILKQAGLK